MTLAGSSAAGSPDLRPGAAAAAGAPLRLGPAAAGRCRRRVHLDADPNAPRLLRSPTDDGLRLRLSDGEAHRVEVLDTLRAVLGEQVDPWDPSGPERPPVVFGPALRSDTRFGSPDLLIWVGDGYRPVIIRAHRTTDPGSGALTAPLDDPLAIAPNPLRKGRPHAADTLALAHFHRLLGDLGLAGSQAFGAVVGRGGSTSASVDRPGASQAEGAAAAPGVADRMAGDAGILLWHQLEVPGASVLADYDLRFHDRLLVATAAASGGPPLALPSRIGECRRCAWWPVCSAQLLAARDVSLIAAGGDVDVLHAVGVRTVDELAGMSGQVAAALPLTGMDPGAARVRARAWLAGLALVRRTDEVLVRRADMELDVDMESFLEDGAYLWGTYLTGPAVESLRLQSGYRAFVSWKPLPDADEGRAFAQFWSYLSELRAIAAAHGLTFAAYCYSRSAEERWLRSTPLRYPDVPGMPTPAQITEFCASEEWVDIYQEIRDQFIVPGSMRLKVLAPIAGFSWRDPEPGGENSMAWYRLAVGSPGILRPDGQPVNREMADRILRYNEDDVLATLALRRWMTERSGEIPTVAEIDRD